MIATDCARRMSVPSELAALGKFSGFKSEPLHDSRKMKVENQAIESMMKTWAESDYKLFFPNASMYRVFLDKIKDLDYRPEDVESFSIALAGFQGEKEFSRKSGLYLSALMNNCKEDGFVIHTTHLSEPISNLGFRNRRNIVVEGDLGTFVGSEMENGTITVHGSGMHVGQDMSGGRIIIEGDCHKAGSNMQGGEIIIHGSIRESPKSSGEYCGIGFETHGGKITVVGDCKNCQNVGGGDITIGGDVEAVGMRNNGAIIRIGGSVTKELGRWMWDGEIHVEGDIPKVITEFGGGKIFHKGKLVVDYPRSYPGSSNKTIELP
jgi:hypothetical protein